MMPLIPKQGQWLDSGGCDCLVRDYEVCSVCPRLRKRGHFFCLFAGCGDGLQFATHVLQLLQNLFPNGWQGVAGFVLGF